MDSTKCSDTLKYLNYADRLFIFYKNLKTTPLFLAFNDKNKNSWPFNSSYIFIFLFI